MNDLRNVFDDELRGTIGLARGLRNVSLNLPDDLADLELPSGFLPLKKDGSIDIVF
jgi:hypothetical protein